jgi:hypothetical protein
VFSSVPLGHRLIAVVAAVVICCGLHAFLWYCGVRSAFAASLSFDSTVAQQLDPRIALTVHPAVVFAQSVLSDSVVSRLVPQDAFTASSTASAIGEFRTRLELTQPTTGLLLVRYRDPDSNQAVETANAIAKVLAGWAPSTTGDTAQKANPRAAHAPASPAPQGTITAESSLASALEELQVQLSAADQRVSPQSSLRSEHDRQRDLESDVRALQQKVDGLGNKFATGHSASGAQVHLDIIQHAFALFWPSAAGLNTAGTSTAQLDYERGQLTHLIGVVKQQQQAAQRAEAANSASNYPSSKQPAPFAPESTSGLAADVPLLHASGATGNPLHLEHTAALPTRVVWWPSVLIGCSGGLLYWGLAFARFRSSRESDDQTGLPEESATFIFPRFDTDAQVRSDSDAKPADPHPVRTSTLKRSFFEFDSDSTYQSASPEPAQGATADNVTDLPEAGAVSTDHDLAQITSDAEVPSHAPGEQNQASPEGMVGMADSWEEEIRKNLSQTSVAHMLDQEPIAEDVVDVKGPARDVGARPPESDRLAG